MDTLERFAEETACPRPIPGNRIRILDDAMRFYDALLEDIRKARNYILMEFFVFREDVISTTILDALAERAEAGVRVCVVLDYFGCLQHFEEKKRWRPMKRSYIQSYRDRGVDLVFYRRKLFFPRNHRKLTLIDGKVAYTGGMNVSDLYKNGIPGVGKFWDMHLRIEGPAVDYLYAGFARIWEECGDQPLGVASPGTPAPCGDTPVIVLESPLPGKNPNPEELYCRLFASAEKSIRLITPYFWPTRSIRRSILAASRRGIRVELLMGANSDLPFSILAAILLHVARKLARKGYFTLHVQPGGFHHDKAVSVDGHLLTVGSYNLEYFSFRINHELGVLLDDPSIAGEFDRYFDKCIHGGG